MCNMSSFFGSDDGAEELESMASILREEINKPNSALMLNPIQYHKFLKVASFLEKLAEDEGGHVIPINVNPAMRHGWFQIEVDVIDLCGEKLKNLINSIRMVDVFSVEPSGRNTLLVGINVNNIFGEIKLPNT